MQKVQSSIILLMIFMAVVFGVGGYLILTYLQDRPDMPEGTIPQTVNDAEVLLTFNPENAVRIVGPASAAIGSPGQQAQPAIDSGVAQTEITAVPTTPALDSAAQQQTELPTATPIPPMPEPTAVPPKITTIPYPVQSGDSLYNIARRTDTSIALMAEYGISATTLIPGTIIDLPIGNPAYCPGRQPYAVGEGDTAFSIGRRFGISAEDLQAINGLDASFTVKVADILCVPTN
ncbi:MAG: LysM peptidoglycan-binding domain-containing protein [Ardenticatenaceae bacterium]|nr:LysM peptidoglycan-binding domain-containing protein [Anaerolineales bacterium]MCB8923920.1 LysM peptidoglycan-binding domain-containing protein [Ardenticatenaceae bacterium]MCB9004383.1 LysM peptidoglycan-binding domain-containing protein [Ardenticatenaceae bacterium]